LLTSEQNLCEMALFKNAAARNGTICYYHNSKEILGLVYLLLPQSSTLTL